MGVEGGDGDLKERHHFALLSKKRHSRNRGEDNHIIIIFVS